VHAYDLALHGGTFLKVHIRGGGAAGYDIGQYFDDTEEFRSILVTNMYISEYSLDLRFHHHGHARLPSEFSTSSAFCEKFRVVIDLLARDNRRLMNLLSFLNQPRFNPLKVYFKDGHDIYPKDFCPG
jgi:hypothetical protein